jgi:DNA end-binding protein Ku
VAIVRFALRQRTQLGALRVHDDVLAVQTLRWPDEVRSFELPEKVAQASVTPRELEMAATLVDSYAEDFQPDKFTDEYRDEMQALIDAKIAGGQAFPEAPAAEQGQDAEVLDLLAALERSVERRGGGAARGGAARGGAARGGARASASRGRAVPEAEPKEPSKARKPRLTAVAQSDDKPRSAARRGRAASDAAQEQAAAAERRHQRKGA